MAIKIDCPRCKMSLRVPNGEAGGYVNCAHCKGRLWVPKDAAADETPVETVTISAGSSQPVVSMEPPKSPSNLPVRGVPSVVTPLSVQAMPAPLVLLQPSMTRNKVARFIAAEAAESTLKLAADGKLPELHLEEGSAEQKAEQSPRSVNPLVMVGVLTISVVLSIVLALVDVDSSPVSGSKKKGQMRQRLADHYFGLGDLDAKRLEPYQIRLREARQAYGRGDYKTERQGYRKVLDMLRAERGGDQRGLTGSRTKDKELEEALLVLLSGG